MPGTTVIIVNPRRAAAGRASMAAYRAELRAALGPLELQVHPPPRATATSPPCRARQGAARHRHGRRQHPFQVAQPGLLSIGAAQTGSEPASTSASCRAPPAAIFRRSLQIPELPAARNIAAAPGRLPRRRRLPWCTGRRTATSSATANIASARHVGSGRSVCQPVERTPRGLHDVRCRFGAGGAALPKPAGARVRLDDCAFESAALSTWPCDSGIRRRHALSDVPDDSVFDVYASWRSVAAGVVAAADRHAPGSTAPDCATSVAASRHQVADRWRGARRHG